MCSEAVTAEDLAPAKFADRNNCGLLTQSLKGNNLPAKTPTNKLYAGCFVGVVVRLQWQLQTNSSRPEEVGNN